MQDLVGMFDPFRVGGERNDLIKEDPLHDLVGMFGPLQGRWGLGSNGAKGIKDVPVHAEINPE